MHLFRLALLLGLLSVWPAGAQPDLARDLVDGLEGVSGVHPGFRRAHAKGVCAAGEFVSSGAGAALSTAATLAPGTVAPATFRFSLAPTNPAAPDNRTLIRGMAFALQLPGGEAHEFATLSAPVFLAKDATTFLGLLHVVAPDPKTGNPDIARFLDFLEAHPDIRPNLDFGNTTAPAASFAADNYQGLHSFLFRDAAGTVRPARWFFEPLGGRVALSRAAADVLGADFLADELRLRVQQAPAEWRVLLQPAMPGDPIEDPTIVWPTAGRERLMVGTLRVTAVDPGTPGACDPMMFDPLRLPDGIAPSADPVLAQRTRAYEISRDRRLK